MEGQIDKKMKVGRIRRKAIPAKLTVKSLLTTGGNDKTYTLT